MFRACELIQLFPVKLSVVRAVHKFDFRLVMNETTNRRGSIFV